MANIIPIGGKGCRFSEAGYHLPKPIIPIGGKPMIQRAIIDMPPSDTWIFLIRSELLEKYHIDQVIQDMVPNPVIIPIESDTDGQACTVELAKPYVLPNEPIFIGACDNGCLYDLDRYQEVINNDSFSCLVWTFTQDPLLLQSPQSWGWVKVSSDEITIEGISCKNPVSESPINDHAIVGSFYFSKAEILFEAIKIMVNENFRINHEFYLDCIPIFLQKMEKKSGIFPVDLYVGYGTPQAIYQYDFNVHAVKYGISVDTLTELQVSLWKKYLLKSG